MNLGHLNAHWLGYLGTALVIIAYVPQIRHLMKMHCGDGISIAAYALWTVSSAFLCVYAIYRKRTHIHCTSGLSCGRLRTDFAVRREVSEFPLPDAS